MTFKTVVRIENMMLFINPKNKDLNLNYIPASPILLCVCVFKHIIIQKCKVLFELIYLTPPHYSL